MKVEKLPKRTKLLWQLRCLMVYFILLALCAYFYTFYSVLLIAGAIITVVCAAIIFWYVPFFIKSYRIICLPDAVIIKRGVIIKTTHIMPYSRLIFTQTFTTPIAKLLGLTAVSLKAARSQVVIPEMSVSDADRILTMLSQGVEE